MKISDLLVFAVYYVTLTDALDELAGMDAELEANRPFTDRVMEALAEGTGRQQEMAADYQKGAAVKRVSTQAAKAEHMEKSMEHAVVPQGTRMTLEHVSFSYPGVDKEVLHDFCLAVEPGERVAVTGRSGSGKTTLVKLLLGMVEPTSGRVTFGGADLRELDLSAMHGRIGYVMQDSLLFNTTIRENLLLGKEDATEDELRRACKKAYILEFVQALPDGLDTVIGEKGIKLSGGQRQRLVLARLFLREVEVFILDEATSALDQYSERMVYDAVQSIPKDKTVIIVAHRESSLAICERRVVVGDD